MNDPGYSIKNIGNQHRIKNNPAPYTGKPFLDGQVLFETIPAEDHRTRVKQYKAVTATGKAMQKRVAVSEIRVNPIVSTCEPKENSNAYMPLPISNITARQMTCFFLLKYVLLLI